MKNGKTVVGAVIVAAGDSGRMNGIDKIFLKIMGRTVLEHTVSAFESSKCIDQIAIVVPPSKIRVVRVMAAHNKWRKIRAVCEGGPRRTDSSYNGFVHLKDSCGYVMVHDGARPLVSERIIRDGLETAKLYGSAIPGISSIDTVKLVLPSGFVDYTLGKESIMMVQTPQVFKTGILMDSYSKCGFNPTDESSMAEAAGHMVMVFKGSPDNIKITFRRDIEKVKDLLRRKDAARSKAVLCE